MLSSRRAVLIFLVVAIALTAAFAQTRPASQKPNSPKPTPTQQPETPPEEPQDIEKITTDTDLVTVPLIASDRDGTYVTDLRQEEFQLLEAGIRDRRAEIEISADGTCSASSSIQFVDRYHDGIRYVPERELWLIWQDGRWTPDRTGGMERLAIELSREMLADASAIGGSEPTHVRSGRRRAARHWHLVTATTSRMRLP